MYNRQTWLRSINIAYKTFELWFCFVFSTERRRKADGQVEKPVCNLGYYKLTEIGKTEQPLFLLQEHFNSFETICRGDWIR